MSPPSNLALPAVLLDRDGTLIEERHYLSDPEQVALLPGAAAAIRRLRHQGFRMVLVTNQSGVARGYFDEDVVERVHLRLAELLAARGARLDHVVHCPHHPDHGPPCHCRKPAPGMAEAAREALDLDLGASWVIGDKLCDVELARNVGAKPILVRTGHGREELRKHSEGLKGVSVAEDLAEAVGIILAGSEEDA